MNALQKTLRWRLNHHYRIHATGICFSVFGIGALVLSFTWFPLLRLWHWRSPEAAQRAIQRSLSSAFRGFIGLMKTLGCLTWEASGLEYLRQPGVLVIANHPTLIDVVYLISFMPQVDCIVKAGLWRNIFLRWPVSWAGYIPNDDDKPEELVARCAAKLKAGRSLIVFPEGTRSVPGQPLNMRRGAAQIALAAGCPVVPATITCTPLTLTKNEPWWQIPERRFHITVDVEPAFNPAEVIEPGLSPPLAARRLTAWFSDYFTARLKSSASQPALPLH